MLLSFLGIAILLGACNKDLALDQEELQLAVGETTVLAVQGADPDAVEWSSSNPQVATVDAQGQVTSVGPGSAVITAKAGGKSATCQVVVIAEPGLSADSIIIGLGDTRQIKIYPAPEGQPAVWQSQDPEIAQVDQAGNIIGRAPGNTQVTVDIGEEKLACQVHVFALDSDKLILAAGEAAALQITNAPAGEPVDWKSSDPRLVSIESSGEIFAAAQGEVVVTATIAGGTAKCAVTVLGLNPHYLALDVGDTQQLQLNPAPEGVVWSSEDAGVVQVDQSGQVTAVASGSSKVFASVAGKKVEATILVATDISRHRTASLTGTISQLRSFNADGSMLISYFPPFGGANENRAVLVDGQGKEYSLPFAPCSDVRWFCQASWRGSRFTYSVVEDREHGDKAAIYVYDAADHSYTDITQGFDWGRYKDLYIYDLSPVFTAQAKVSVVFPDGLWEYSLAAKAWTQVAEFQRGLGPYNSYPTFWSPDFSKVAWLEEVQGNNKLTVFDVKSAGLSSYPVPGTMADLAWSPDSAKLAWVDEISLGEVEKLVVLDLDSAQRTIVHQSEDIAGFVWPDSKTLAVADCRPAKDWGMIWNRISVVDLAGKELKSFPDPGNTLYGRGLDTSLSLVLGQKLVAYDADAGLILLRLTDGKRWLIRPPHPSEETKAHELYEPDQELPMRYTWLENGNLAMVIHLGDRLTHGTLEIYKIDWKNWR